MTYQAISKRYRPKRFTDVIGQLPIISTLQNALSKNKVGHAYLFSGAKGTGKTTIARIFAKALNCLDLQGTEPCNQCSCCKDIQSGHSLDVIEIDGASHRGIEDIRALNESVCFAPSKGRYKIYIIDEVHMLTKEAFNALLKTLEEPPEKALFFLATTESHKLPATILSRCQKFMLQRISQDKIIEKLSMIAQEAGCSLDSKILDLIAKMSSGGLRDAESLLDQLFAYDSQHLSYEKVLHLLGLVSEDILKSFDQACQNNDYQQAFEIADTVFSSGKNIAYFIEELVEYFRSVLKKNLATCAQASFYHHPILVEMLEILMKAQQEIKTALDEKTFFEVLLLQLIKKANSLPYHTLLSRLESLRAKSSEPKSALPKKEPLKEKVVKPKKTTPLKASLVKTSVEKTPSPTFKKETLIQFARQELKTK